MKPPALALGTVQFGVPYGITNQKGQVPRQECFLILDEARKRGVHCVDTARGYGESESVLGEYLSLRGRDSLQVVTKLLPLPAPAPSLKALTDAVDHSLFESLRNLGGDRIPALLLHRWSDRKNGQGEAWKRLLEHQAEGRIGALGASVQSVTEFLEATSDPAIKHIQFPFNILDHRWESSGAFRAAEHRPDISFYVRSVFLQGLLLSTDASSWPAVAGVEPLKILGTLNDLQAGFQRESRADLCIAFVRSYPWIRYLVIGVTHRDELGESIRAFERPLLTRGERESLREKLDELALPEALLNPAQWPKRP